MHSHGALAGTMHESMNAQCRVGYNTVNPRRLDWFATLYMSACVTHNLVVNCSVNNTHVLVSHSSNMKKCPAH
jgi:hypothetical protein